jgi:hypothetical protein
MDNVVGNTWQTLIPGQSSGSAVSYYLYAVDAGGKTALHPLIGMADPHIYYPGGMQEPQLTINPAVIEMELTADTTATSILELTNTGGGVINYSLEFQDTSRNISGSSVICDEEYFSPGETTTFSFTASNESIDDEWINGVTIIFPVGFEVINASDFAGGSDLLEYDGTSGDGVTITWFGETPSQYGVLHGGESASADVEISVSTSFSGDAILEWTLSGDNYGTAPHTMEGEMNLEIYGGAVSWISVNQPGGELWAMETDEIMLTFDTTGLEAGLYSCNLIVSDDNGNQNTVPVMLTVNSTADDNDQLTLVTDSYVYPNPIYQNGSRNSSNFYFSLTNPASDVTISVYNIRGQKTADLYAGALSAGEHQFNWSTGDAAAGIYLYILKAGNTLISEKIILLK